MPVQSAFTLNSNEIFASIANMIISQQVFINNIGTHQTLVDKARVDGSMYGDKKIYYSTDVLKTHAWGKDAEAANLLALHRPKDPKAQAINLDVFRQIDLTVDYYLSKRAWASEGAFSDFTSVMLGWIRETKKVYDGTHYNTFIGITESSVGKQQQTVALTSGKEGQAIAEKIANLLVEMSDYSRDFNDYGYLRSYTSDSIKVIWNSKFVNQIKKVDTPTIYHRQGLVDKLDEDILPERYFGIKITADNVASYSAATPTAGKPLTTAGVYTPGTAHANGCIRSLVEFTRTVNGEEINYFPGDEIPAGETVKASGGDFALGEVYIEDAKIICKVLVELPPYMSAFEVGTSFFNQKSLTENHYLTFGHNTIEKLLNYPFVTVRKA